MTCKVDGEVVKVGDIVYFKSDIEQCGEIVKIQRAQWGYNDYDLTLKSVYDGGFDGDYIGGSDLTVERASDCWLEGR